MKKSKKTKYTCFFRDTKENGYLSQWYPATFKETIGNTIIQFENAEKYMMYHKALLFKDERMAEEILRTVDPKILKALGRKIKNIQIYKSLNVKLCQIYVGTKVQ